MNKENIVDLEIAENPNLKCIEKETQCIIERKSLIVHSDHRTGIRWCVSRLKDNTAELMDYHIVNDKLVSIQIKTTPSLISFKSKPRQLTNISSCFNV